jgi:hypothetical protein
MCGMESAGSEEDPVAGFCDLFIESLVSMKAGHFLTR